MRCETHLHSLLFDTAYDAAHTGVGCRESDRFFRFRFPHTAPQTVLPVWQHLLAPAGVEFDANSGMLWRVQVHANLVVQSAISSERQWCMRVCMCAHELLFCGSRACDLRDPTMPELCSSNELTSACDSECAAENAGSTHTNWCVVSRSTPLLNSTRLSSVNTEQPSCTSSSISSLAKTGRRETPSSATAGHALRSTIVKRQPTPAHTVSHM